uniref:Uncharacterized protein n=1 Tax=Arundo donax TaxID=35708 RepID=A0A0A9HLA1_ARUDO
MLHVMVQYSVNEHEDQNSNNQIINAFVEDTARLNSQTTYFTVHVDSSNQILKNSHPGLCGINLVQTGSKSYLNREPAR